LFHCKLKLVKLIEKGSWDRVTRFIRRHRISKYRDHSGLSPLALLITSFPPISVVKTLLKCDPEATTRTDSFGATPLHLACLNGVTAETVKLIIDHDQGCSARMLDNDHYTVLHHAVEYICLLIEKRSSLPSDSSISIASEHNAYMEIVQMLCDAAPEMVFQTTKDSGDTPLDIPQIVLTRHSHQRNKYHYERISEVYQMLKKTSIKVYTERKHKWERDGYVINDRVNCEVSIPSLVSSNFSSQSSRQLSR